jgi:periplasmic divalent cation tolerance protein
MAKAFVVLTTTSDRATAERIAHALVEERLAACVNLVPGVRSIYRWKGAVEAADEVLCVIKTTAARLPRLKARLVALHPYDVPEVIALPIAAGHTPYLGWLADAVRPAKASSRARKTSGSRS